MSMPLKSANSCFLSNKTCTFVNRIDAEKTSGPEVSPEAAGTYSGRALSRAKKRYFFRVTVSVMLSPNVAYTVQVPERPSVYVATPLAFALR